DAALAAQLDEMRTLDRAFGEQDAVIGENADRHAVQMREATDERRAVKAFELVELAVIDDPRDDLARVIGRAQIGGHDAVQFGRIVARWCRSAQRERRTLYA